MDLLNRFTNAVIFSAEAASIKDLVVAAVAAKADLCEANLRGADLRGADLCEADLCGANAEINGHRVLQLNGLPYPILITDTHLRAGCQIHTFSAWRKMSPDQIAEMDGDSATEFYPVLLSILDTFCKDRETPTE